MRAWSCFSIDSLKGMDDNSWRTAQGRGVAGEASAMPNAANTVALTSMDSVDWRTQLQDDSRQIIVNKIMDAFKKHLPFSGQEGLQKLKKIAVRFEEKTYTAATSQSDYIEKIALKMFTVEMKPQNPIANSNSSKSPPDPVSPQVLKHPALQMDRQNILSSMNKTGTPLQSANSPFIVPSPSTPLAPSPMPRESEKVNSSISSLSNAGNIGQLQTTTVSGPAQSLAIGTSGISASPLLVEFASLDDAHVNASSVISSKSNAVEQPFEHLIKAVKSVSHEALTAAVSDISSVVSMIHRIAGSAPGNGSRAAVGEDLVAMTKCRLQDRSFFTEEGHTGTKKMKHSTGAMSSNVASSASSINESPRLLDGYDTSEVESTATSSIKRSRTETNHALLEEIHEINCRLIDTVVDICNEDVDPTAVAAAAEGGEGTIVKCSFSAVALIPNLKSEYASAQMSPIQPLRLLIPSNYPNWSPVHLDKFPFEVSKEYGDLSIKAKSRFSMSLRSLPQPMSLEEMAKTWDMCARAVISEYARQSGGGTFSSKYGTWENCLSAS